MNPFNVTMRVVLSTPDSPNRLVLEKQTQLPFAPSVGQWLEFENGGLPIGIICEMVTFRLSTGTFDVGHWPKHHEGQERMWKGVGFVERPSDALPRVDAATVELIAALKEQPRGGSAL